MPASATGERSIPLPFRMLSVSRIRRSTWWSKSFLAGIDADRVAVGKLLEAVRQLRGGRNFAAADQDRNDGDAFLERRLDLDADLIVVLVDPGASSGVEPRQFGPTTASRTSLCCNTS